MSTKELKQKIHKLVDISGQKQLKSVFAILEDAYKTEVVPELGCTLEEYNKELDEADAAIKRGEYYTQEEVFDYINKKLAEQRDKAKVE